jgi:hypothetical protein
LSCAAAAVRKHREILTVAVGGLCTQVAWLCVWLLALLGSALKHHRERQESLPPSSKQYAAYEATTGWPGTEHAEADAAEQAAAAEKAENAQGSGSSGSSSSSSSSSSKGGSDDGNNSNDNEYEDDKYVDDDDAWTQERHGTRQLKKHGKHKDPAPPSPIPSSASFDDDDDDDDDALVGLNEALAAAAAAKADDNHNAPAPAPSVDSSSSSFGISEEGSGEGGSEAVGKSPLEEPAWWDNVAASANATTNNALGYYYSYYDDNSVKEPIGSHGGMPNFGKGHKNNKDGSGVGNGLPPQELSVAEYYGLGDGCKTVFVDHKDVADFHLASALANNTYGVYCACARGSLLSLGSCDGADYFYVELKQNAWVYLLFAASLFWGFQVIAGVVHVTSAGAVASWWFDVQPGAAHTAPPSTSKGGKGRSAAYTSVSGHDPEDGQGIPPPPPPGAEDYSPGAGTGHKVPAAAASRHSSEFPKRSRGALGATSFLLHVAPSVCFIVCVCVCAHTTPVRSISALFRQSAAFFLRSTALRVRRGLRGPWVPPRGAPRCSSGWRSSKRARLRETRPAAAGRKPLAAPGAS